MPRDMPAGLQDLLDSGDCESHSAIDVYFEDGSELHLATADIVVPDWATYSADLRQTGAAKATLRQAADGVSLAAQNIDRELGTTVLGASDLLDGAEVAFCRIFCDEGRTQVYRVSILEGEVVNAQVTNAEVNFSLVSHISAGGVIAAIRALAKACQNTYKDKNCGSLSPDGFCSKIFDDKVNGCASKLAAARITTPAAANNQDSYTGFIFLQPSATGGDLTPGPGGPIIIGGPGHGGIVITGPGGLDPDDPRGRFRIPVMLAT